MAKSFTDLRVLLVQARNTPDIEEQEQACFLERSRLAPQQLHTVNVVRDRLHDGLLDGVDAFMIGGAGEYSAKDDHPWMPALLHLVHTASQRRLPTFGSCWGHQIIARAFGGTVIYDKARAELGCVTIRLTEAASDDPLFRSFPVEFLANAGHHDRVIRLPDQAVELAYNDSQRNQAFRIGDLPVYGTQFHSELDADAERERLIAYRDYYSEEWDTDEAFELTLHSLADTTEVDHLLHDFLLVHALHVRPTLERNV